MSSTSDVPVARMSGSEPLKLSETDLFVVDRLWQRLEDIRCELGGVA